jgi:hypothetical protein
MVNNIHSRSRFEIDLFTNQNITFFIYFKIWIKRNYIFLLSVIYLFVYVYWRDYKKQKYRMSGTCDNDMNMNVKVNIIKAILQYQYCLVAYEKVRGP